MQCIVSRCSRRATTWRIATPSSSIRTSCTTSSARRPPATLPCSTDTRERWPRSMPPRICCRMCCIRITISTILSPLSRFVLPIVFDPPHNSAQSDRSCLISQEGFIQTDTAFNNIARERGFRDGTTAVCALLRDDHLLCAWLGDSEALLCRAGKGIVLTTKHTPERPDEKRRVQVGSSPKHIYWLSCCSPHHHHSTLLLL
jgi:hypothetical protein